MGFRGKQIVTLTLVAASVALTTSLLNAALLARLRVTEARESARLLARTLYHLAGRAILEHPHDEVADALAGDPALRAYADAVIGYSPVALYVAIVDADGYAIFHSNRRLEGQTIRRGSVGDFAEGNSLGMLLDLMRAERALVVDLPFTLDGRRPFGSVEVAVSTVILRQELLRAVAAHAALAAAVVTIAFGASFYLANRLLRPVEMLRRELARIDFGGTGPPLDFRTEKDVGRLSEFFASIGEKLRDGSETGIRRDWLGAMLSAFSDAVLVLDGECRILSLNESAAKLLGRRGDAIEGRNLAEVVPEGHPLARVTREALRQHSDVGPRRVSLPVDGADATFLLGVRVLWQDRRPTGVIVTARDLESLSRLASHLSYSQKLAALGHLTSGVAHEIKNPLNAMVMHLGLLRDRAGEDPEVGRYLDVLDQEIRRLDRVIHGFLVFSRPERLRIESVDLGPILQEVAGAAAAGRGQALRVETELPPDLPPVLGDADLIRQVFTNLVTNAREAMENGGRLQVRAVAAGPTVRVTVRDDGGGIREKELPHIFKLFHTTKRHGSGIGLSVVYRIVQLHGGDVSVDSKVGEGTTVTVTLPLDTP